MGGLKVAVAPLGRQIRLSCFSAPGSSFDHANVEVAHEAGEAAIVRERGGKAEAAGPGVKEGGGTFKEVSSISRNRADTTKGAPHDSVIYAFVDEPCAAAGYDAHTASTAQSSSTTPTLKLSMKPAKWPLPQAAVAKRAVETGTTTGAAP